MDGQSTYALGKQDSARWSVGPDPENVPTISYTSGENAVVIELICSNDGTNLFEVLEEGSNNTYHFRLVHENVCWNGYSGR